jgi:hypothetical protein
VDQLVVVTYPEPLTIEAQGIEHDAIPESAVALGYYYDGKLIARGVVAPEAVEAIRALLSSPVRVALAATEDDGGNIDARVCLVLPVDPSQFGHGEEDDEPDEPWRASVPPPPMEAEASGPESEGEKPARMALLPIGNVVRSYRDRNHPDDVEVDVREMLDNLLHGRGKDAVQKAIDDLLGSL